jgi:pimeloyl-ACP methyl ester carboxylesterase
VSRSRGAEGSRRPRALAGVPVVAAVLAALLAAPLVVGCTSAAQARPGASHRAVAAHHGVPAASGAAPDTLAGFYAQRLRWQACDNGFRCARMSVPFDYGHPAGPTFSLPVIMLPAADPAHRIGSLVLNPGGSGGSWIEYALTARSQLPAAIRDRFDVVGFDPRGVGDSVPALHCMTGPQLDRYLDTNDTPANAAQLGAVVTENKLYASECEKNSGPLLAHVGTRDAARDMDVLRAALGEEKLTYLGKSYGTYLGTWYAQLFPAHVRALVLDGAVDPDASALATDTVQAQGFQAALNSFAASCMSQRNCPLGHGTNAAAGVAKVQSLLARATQKPLANDLGDGRAADGALLVTGIAAGLYSKSYWPTLRTALQDAFGGDGTVLIELADLLMERNSNGTYSNLDDADTAINCLDRPWPRNLTAWESAADAAAKAAPVFGAPEVWQSLACAYWPVPSGPLPSIRAAGAPPILVIGTTRDPATPYAWARALSRDLASGVLLGWNGDGHTAYGSGSACVDNYVNSYLTGLSVPKSGTVCP